MSASKIYNYLLELFRWLLDLLIKPFTDPNGSLETYSKRGYWALGVFLTLLVLGLWLAGINITVDNIATRFDVDLAEIHIKGIGLGFTKDIPIFLMPVFFYLLGLFLFRGKLRQGVGRWFINLVIRVLDLAISLAEKSLVHKITSLWVFSFLVVAVTLSVGGEAYLYNRSSLREHDFANWLEAADKFVRESTLTQPKEVKAYADNVQSLWKADLASTDDKAARIALQQFLDLLYAKQNLGPSKQENWNKWLVDNQTQIEQACLNCKLEDIEVNIQETRSWILLNLIKGRIYIQISHDCADDKNNQCPYLAKAKKYFDVAGEAVSKLSTAVELHNRYNCAVNNGLGRVYANAMKLFQTNDKIDLNAQMPAARVAGKKHSEVAPEKLSPPCENADKCAEVAYRSYMDSCSKYQDCGFEAKRKENNITDFLVKYSEGASVGKRRSLSPNIKTPEDLASTIENQVKKAIDCNTTPPVVPEVFVTAAEAYATCAYLRKSDKEADLDSAFKYWSLAYTLKSTSIDGWDMKPFCRLIAGNFITESKLRERLSKNAVKGWRPFSESDINKIISRLKKEEGCRK